MISLKPMYILIITFQFVLGCDSQVDIPNPFEKEGAWEPEFTTLTCRNNGQCPEALGILFIVEDDGIYSSIYRCTGELYDFTKVLTASHCAEKINLRSRSYFRTVAKEGRPSQMVRVSKVLQRSFLNEDIFRPDYASLELVEPLTGIDFVRPLRKVPTETGHFLALVANPKSKDSEDHFVIDAVRCRHNGKSYPIPIPFRENPDVFSVTDCKLFSGNSGGALVFENDLLSVAGVLQISNNANGIEKKEKANNSAKDHIDFAGAANARCFSLPGWARAEKDCQPITRERVEDLINQGHFLADEN